MKRSFLLASAALVALASAAQQYDINPSTQVVIDKGINSVYGILISEAAINDFENAGVSYTYIGPSPDDNRNMWLWENTFVECTTKPLRVDMEEGEPMSIEVANNDWSGGGLAVAYPGVDVSSFNDDTRFHMAYMTPTDNAPAALGIILFNGDNEGSVPAKFAVGGAFSDEGKPLPVIGKPIQDDWNAIDISLGELRKLYGALTIAGPKNWIGNLWSILAGGGIGRSIAFDAVYFYNIGEGNSVNEIGSESNFVITGKTVNALGGNGIELYSLDGKLVKSSNGTTLGLNGLSNGMYVVRNGAKAQKVVIR